MAAHLLAFAHPVVVGLKAGNLEHLRRYGPRFETSISSAWKRSTVT
jgi:hypothetical protein